MGYPQHCCGQGTVSNVTPKPTDCTNCLFIPNFTYANDPNALPCGVTAPVATLDLKALPGAQLDVCTGTIDWQIVDYDATAFFSISITDGVISFQINSGVDIRVVQDVLVRAACDDPALSVIACIGILPYDACSNANCGPAERCDPCDGLCAPISDIEVS